MATEVTDDIASAIPLCRICLKDARRKDKGGPRRFPQTVRFGGIERPVGLDAHVHTALANEYGLKAPNSPWVCGSCSAHKVGATSLAKLLGWTKEKKRKVTMAKEGTSSEDPTRAGAAAMDVRVTWRAMLMGWHEL